MIKDLQLSWTKHPDKSYEGRGYFDFIISGQRLREYLQIQNRYSVTAIGFFENIEQQIIALKQFRLQQKTLLPGDRIELYICESCGDIACGSITARIIDNGERIIWTAFAHQSDPDEHGEVLNVADLEFDRQQYFKAFSSIKEGR